MPVKTFDEVTPAWLTEILTSRGSLISGAVEHIEQKRDLNRVTHNATLHLSYAPNSRGRCPTKLFFKQDHRASEAKFYQSIAPTLTGVVVPTCYDAPYDDLNSHVLLEYVEGTHFTPPETLPISLACHEKVIDALSDVHSQFWDHPRLEDIGTLATDISAFTFTVSSQHFAVFVDYLGDRLSAKRRGYYEKILAEFPKYRSKTLVHGDAHWWNFLYPYDPTTQPLYLLDWAMWNLNFGVSDIAFNIALQCYPQHRSEIEKLLVKRYHQ